MIVVVRFFLALESLCPTLQVFGSAWYAHRASHSFSKRFLFFRWSSIYDCEAKEEMEKNRGRQKRQMLGGTIGHSFYIIFTQSISSCLLLNLIIFHMLHNCGNVFCQLYTSLFLCLWQRECGWASGICNIVCAFMIRNLKLKIRYIVLYSRFDLKPKCIQCIAKAEELALLCQ